MLGNTTFQIFLTAALLGYILYAQTQKQIAYLLSEVTSAAAVVGLILVWRPDLANVLAHRVGVGRGTDLILYCFIVVGMIVTLNVHLRVKGNLAMITDLARAIAILNPVLPKIQSGEHIKNQPVAPVEPENKQSSLP